MTATCTVRGAHVQIAFQMFPLGTDLRYLMTIIATEVGGDGTEFRGFGGSTLSLKPPLPAGFTIVSVNGATASSADCTDQDTKDGLHLEEPGKCVARTEAQRLIAMHREASVPAVSPIWHASVSSHASCRMIARTSASTIREPSNFRAPELGA